MFAETPWLWLGLFAYLIALLLSFGAINKAPERRRQLERIILSALVTGVVFLVTCLALRWLRIGHGPFVNLFELLISQLCSLGLVYTLVYWRWPVIRPTSVVVLPIIWVLGAWVLSIENTASPYPPTYYNPWLWAHVGVGKIFLAFTLVASGLAGVIVLRQCAVGRRWFASLPDTDLLDRFAWQFMIIALVFDSMMLIFGAVWAQDAWGRYWKWDPLETSAFLTWLAIGVSIHLRLTCRVPKPLAACFIIGIFILAFATYFSTPFISQAAHKGVI